jgi:uncharacterized membrane protein
MSMLYVSSYIQENGETDMSIKNRIASIDLLRGIVILLMALDHVRMYFGYGTWYSEPTDLSTTTPLLFFTRWITHFCAPVFVFLAGTSAFILGTQKETVQKLSRYLWTRGLWLILVEIVIVNLAWTFDLTYSFILLQVIWVIGISMLVLSALVFLQDQWILIIGLTLVLGHNLLDNIQMSGSGAKDLLWYTLHQPDVASIGGHLVNFVYPVLPWIGLMALGYICGNLYKKDFPAEQRKRHLLTVGAGAILLFLLLRGFNLYGEPNPYPWSTQSSTTFTVLSFLNLTKYPPSLQFLLMTMGPALIFLALSEFVSQRISRPFLTFGRVPLFFYIAHLYIIHTLAMAFLAYSGRDWREYIISAQGIRSGALINFGLDVGGIYLVWLIIIVLMYPLCKWYQAYKENNSSKWWLSYL